MDAPYGRNGPLQALAPGFLSLLGLKQGALPADLVQVLNATIDLFPFYQLGTRETLSNGAPQGVGPPNVLYLVPEYQVPANEVWWVHGYVAQVAVAAANSWTGAIVHTTRNSVTIRNSANQTVGGAAAGVTTALPPSIGGFLAAPGDFFGILTQDSTGAGAKTLSSAITISRFVQ